MRHATIRVAGTFPAVQNPQRSHPFHIHVNSFEVISVTVTKADQTRVETMLPPGTIQDTIGWRRRRW